LPIYDTDQESILIQKHSDEFEKIKTAQSTAILSILDNYLSDDERMVIKLIRTENSYRQTAVILGKTKGSVRRIYKRGERKLTKISKLFVTLADLMSVPETKRIDSL